MVTLAISKSATQIIFSSYATAVQVEVCYKKSAANCSLREIACVYITMHVTMYSHLCKRKYLYVSLCVCVCVGGGMQTNNAAQRSASAAEGDRQHGRALLRIEGHPPVLIHRS